MSNGKIPTYITVISTSRTQKRKNTKLSRLYEKMLNYWIDKHRESLGVAFSEMMVSGTVSTVFTRPASTQRSRRG